MNNKKTNTLLACEQCKKAFYENEKTVFIDLEPQRRQYCTAQCWENFKSSFQPGMKAKDLQWHWGGTIEAVNRRQIFIRVGNRETGETYPVTFERCILILNT